MLGKLLKYDFRALSRIMIPLQIGVFVIGLLGFLLLNFSMQTLSNTLNASDLPFGYYTVEDTIQSTASIFSTMLFGLVFASTWVTLILIARHFYKNFFSDEGYLSFTLPVSAGQHLLSKLICGSVWVALNAAVLLLLLFLFPLIGISGLSYVDTFDFYEELFLELINPLGIVFTIQIIFVGLVGIVFNVMQIYFAFTAGNALARTHKIIASVGVYLASTTVVNIIMVFNFFIMEIFADQLYYSTNADYDWILGAQPYVISLSLLGIGLSLLYFFISNRILKKSLNLD